MKAVLYEKPVDDEIQQCQRNADRGEFEESESCAAVLFCVLYDNDVACGAEDEEISGDGASSGKIDHLLRRGTAVHNKRQIQRHQRDIGNELAQKDADGKNHGACSHIEGNFCDCRLEKSAIPDTLHEHKKGRKEDQRRPVDVAGNGNAPGAEKDDRCGGNKGDIGQLEIGG